jgi:DNA repair exonuclease SbcCD ATPase subunit
MDNLESAVAETEEQVAELLARRAELDRNLQELEQRHRMLEGKEPEAHRHRCPHCGAYSVCPQAYGEDCPLDATAPADCRDDPYREE